ncbi:protein translocase subunit SecF [candidate division WWE3 bacterium]|uniref:Protein-export membrane protein SecF n=1 Tax=candidate division WWE3 bacterium TaxID=2053526 RepID=A0A955LVR6_UNCKA|nr:protein translocase subunit SecF [candidate division WWE3 bacterium]
MQYKKIYFLISAIVIIPGIISLVAWGLRPSIDFVGGTVWELQLPTETDNTDDMTSEIVTVVESNGVEVFDQNRNDANVLQLKLSSISSETKNAIQTQFNENEQISINEVRFEMVGATLGRELMVKTLTGVLLATLGILTYVAWRFKDRMYGVCAILAMFHDTFIVIGVFSLLGHFYNIEVDALFVTAVLTILSFSVHDTIVVYDRIRESIRKYPKLDFVSLINKAVSETLVRSLNNSLTIIFMLSALLLLGGESIRWFIFALLIGTISGTYSSTFTAAPLLALWHERLSSKTTVSSKRA